jgi:hypothetical protein
MIIYNPAMMETVNPFVCVKLLNIVNVFLDRFLDRTGITEKEKSEESVIYNNFIIFKYILSLHTHVSNLLP